MLAVTLKRHQNNLRRDVEADREDAGADAGGDEEVVTVLDDVAGCVALTLI